MTLINVPGEVEQRRGFKKGLKQQHRIRGHPRRFHLHIIVSSRLQLALMKGVRNRHQSKGLIVEEALWRELGRLTARDKTELIQRLKYVDALITELISLAMSVETAGQVKIAGQVSVNVHAKEARQERRNELSQKVHTATNQVFDLAQTEALAEENQMRAMMYGILSQLAAVDALILRDAAEEEILEAMNKLREEQGQFEEAARQLEDGAREVSGKI